MESMKEKDSRPFKLPAVPVLWEEKVKYLSVVLQSTLILKKV
jgi:hypothetical protein